VRLSSLATTATLAPPPSFPPYLLAWCALPSPPPSLVGAQLPVVVTAAGPGHTHHHLLATHIHSDTAVPGVSPAHRVT
jgi:hypothetical protein